MDRLLLPFILGDRLIMCIVRDIIVTPEYSETGIFMCLKRVPLRMPQVTYAFTKVAIGALCN
jgi:hypothetical protein